MVDLALEARNRAGDNFKQGFNCAESILKAFNEILDNPLSPETVKLATGFGGGIGHAGCVCGALAASTMVIGIVKGRTHTEESRDPAYELAREFHDHFEAKFGGTCCRSLNPYTFDTPEHLRNCLKITGSTGKLLMEFLQEKNLFPK